VTEPTADPTPEKTPAEQALDHALEVFVYAPIGLLFEGASLLPQLVEKGKSQVTMARMIGQFAVTQGQGEAGKAVNRLQDQAISLLARLGGSTAPEPPITPAAMQDPPSPAAALDTEAAAAPAATAPSATPPSATPVPAPSEPAATTDPPVDVASLAIPDYDGLSASHVVNRLAGLSAAELEAVRAYEAANRGRKTILSKVAQLQAG
jgi:hypothetical protein